MTQPTIVFINTDQQSYEAMSARDNPWLHTPNMDRLYRHGVTFERSYCTDPVCAPARASWITGTYPSEHGVVFNGVPMHEQLTDLGRVLRAEGHRAAHAGTWHVSGRATDTSFHVVYRGLNPIRASGGQVYDPTTTHAAMDFLLRNDRRKPFFLQIGLINPHDVCHFGSRYGSETIPDDLASRLIPQEQLPPSLFSSVDESSEILTQRVFRRERGAIHHDETNQAMQRWGEQNWRYYRWNYYRFVEEADREIGLILDLIEQSPWREQTLIIFGSDHGEACGRHQTFQKFSLYEESVRVPLIVSSFGEGFGIDKGSYDRVHIVSGVDVMPTVLDYAGVQVPAQVHGRTLRPLIEGRGVDDWPGYAYVESNYWSRAVVTDRYKYITEYIPHGNEVDLDPPSARTHRRGLEQLYDLEVDPGESRNVVAAPAHGSSLGRCRQLLTQHETRLATRPIDPRYAAQIRESGPRIREHYRRRREAWGPAGEAAGSDV
jgi:arylsulfatase A-like enzyme